LQPEDTPCLFEAFFHPLVPSYRLFWRQASAQGAVTDVTNEEALQRSVDMASRMAGWAGRVVERVLKEHRQASSGFLLTGSASSHAFRQPRDT